MTFRLNNGFGTTSSPSGGAVVSPTPDNALPSDVSARLNSLESRPVIEGGLSNTWFEGVSA